MINVRISIPLGIAIGLLASFVQSLGLTIQRKSHVINQGLPEHKRLVEHRRPLWLLGFAIFISSNLIGSLVQIAALPVVILAPLGAVSLLWNAFFAKLLLGDVFSPWLVLGTLFIAGGAVLIAVFGIVPEQTRSLEDLLKLFRRPTFVAYFSVLGVVVFVCLAITHVTEFSLARRKNCPITPQSSLESTPSSLTLRSLTYQPDQGEVADVNNATEHTPLLHKSNSSVDSNQQITTSPKNTQLLLAISYASFSGIISGMCLLFAKSGVELLLLTLRGQNQFWRWEAWVLVMGLGAFALFQLWYLHKALIYADPTLVCPSAFCFYNVSSIVNGLIYFDQFSLIPAKHLMLVSLGMVILLGGVWVVSIQSGSGVVDVASWEEANKTARVAGSIVQSSEHDSATAFTSALPEEEASYPTSTPGTISMNVTLDDQASTVDSALRKKTSHNRRPTIDMGLLLHARSLSHSQAQSSPPLIGTGLQIGLSPVSPGFAILPKERRRRVSGMMESPHQGLESGAGLRPDRVHVQRRAVSENDVGDAETGWRPMIIPPAEITTQSRSKDDGAWRWVRRVFIRGQ